jgi:hypothetical protein
MGPAIAVAAFKAAILRVNPRPRKARSSVKAATFIFATTLIAE